MVERLFRLVVEEEVPEELFLRREGAGGGSTGIAAVAFGSSQTIQYSTESSLQVLQYLQTQVILIAI